MQGSSASARTGSTYPVPHDRSMPNFRPGYRYVSPSGRLCFYVEAGRGDDLHFVYARQDGKMPKSARADGFSLHPEQAHLMRVAG